MSSHRQGPRHTRPRNATLTRIALAVGMVLVVVTLGFGGYAAGTSITSARAPAAAASDQAHAPGHEVIHPITHHPQAAPVKPRPAPANAHLVHLDHITHVEHLRLLHAWHVLHVLHLVHVAGHILGGNEAMMQSVWEPTPSCDPWQVAKPVEPTPVEPVEDKFAVSQRAMIRAMGEAGYASPWCVKGMPPAGYDEEPRLAGWRGARDHYAETGDAGHLQVMEGFVTLDTPPLASDAVKAETAAVLVPRPRRKVFSAFKAAAALYVLWLLVMLAYMLAEGRVTW